MNKIFGLGSGRSGTTTLQVCLTKLEFTPHYSWGWKFAHYLDSGHPKLGPILESTNRGRSFSDFPWNYCDYYKTFDKKFKGSKFILTNRDTEKWHDSLVRWHTTKSGSIDWLCKVPHSNNLNGMSTATAFSKVHKNMYNTDERDLIKAKSIIIDAYNKRNEDIIEYFKDRPEDFLVVNWEEEASWGPLCKFLNVPEPKIDFPWYY
jgi:hypothetical protein